jgi:lysophospholipase L1-like esterase
VTRFPTQTALTIASLGALFALLPRVAPAIKGPSLSQLASLAEFDPDRTPLLPLTPHRTEEIAVEPPIRFMVKLTPPLLEDSNGGLDRFYAALWRTERKEAGAVTRVTHYGDSPTTADLITGDIRAQMQARFGDAGHGFILLAKPWAWYQHRGVSLSGGGWQIVPATHAEIKDGFFGLGGVSFTAGAAARTRLRLDHPGQSRFELYYLQQPGGGTVTITTPDTGPDRAQEVTVAEIPTAGDTKSPGFAPFTVEGGASELELRTVGQVRLFGLTAEKPGPGVVYDSLGLNGASITVLSHVFNQQHWAAELRQRNPNLVVINYGTNEADFSSFVDKHYEGELREAIRRMRAALPGASVLVMSPMDRGYLTGPGEIETMATIPRIVAIQRRVAAETGCGFFDTFTAMGGAGTMARWYASQPRLVSADFIHPSPAGGKIVATVFVKQIESGLARYKLRQLQNQSSAGGAVR